MKGKKMKKNAADPIDLNKEKDCDPKYKTELCKTFEKTNFCPYGNKCRFAHGKEELFEKSECIFNYKKKDCKSFYSNIYCIYGSRCLFKHSDKFENQDRMFYTGLLAIRSYYQIIANKKNNEDDIYNVSYLDKDYSAESYLEKNSFMRYDYLNKYRLNVFKDISCITQSGYLNQPYQVYNSFVDSKSSSFTSVSNEYNSRFKDINYSSIQDFKSSQLNNKVLNFNQFCSHKNSIIKKLEPNSPSINKQQSKKNSCITTKESTPYSSSPNFN